MTGTEKEDTNQDECLSSKASNLKRDSMQNPSLRLSAELTSSSNSGASTRSSEEDLKALRMRRRDTSEQVPGPSEGNTKKMISPSKSKKDWENEDQILLEDEGSPPSPSRRTLRANIQNAASSEASPRKSTSLKSAANGGNSGRDNTASSASHPVPAIGKVPLRSSLLMPRTDAIRGQKLSEDPINITSKRVVYMWRRPFTMHLDHLLSQIYVGTQIYKKFNYNLFICIFQFYYPLLGA